MRLTLLTVAIVLTGAATGAGAAKKGAPLDDVQCKAAWTIVSPNSKAITQGETVPSIIDFTMVDTNKDAAIDTDEFKGDSDAGLDRAGNLDDPVRPVSSPSRLVLGRDAGRFRG